MARRVTQPSDTHTHMVHAKTGEIPKDVRNLDE